MSESDAPVKEAAQMQDEILDFFEQSAKRQMVEAEETKKHLSALREVLKTMGADGGLPNKEVDELRNSLNSLKEAHNNMEAELKLRTDELEMSRKKLEDTLENSGQSADLSLQQEIDGLKESELELISAATTAEEKLQKQNAELAKLKLQLEKESAERRKLSASLKESRQKLSAYAGAAPDKPQDEFAGLKQAVKKNPKDLKTLCQLAKAYIGKDRFNEAIPHLLTAVKLKPGDPEIQFLLGDTYYKGKHFEDSLPHLNQAVKLKPKFAKAHYDLCMVNEMVGNEEEAGRHYKIAIKLDPNIESST